MSGAFDPEALQGNILRGYRRALVRHVMLGVRDRAAARGFLAASVAGGSDAVPAITRENHRHNKWTPQTKPPVCFNLGLTHAGLRALGVPAQDLASFPTEFVEGMARRARKLGDYGDSAPDRWPAPFDRPGRIHLVASIHADDRQPLDRLEGQLARAFDVLGVRDGRNLPEDKVVFGYRDNISQPRFEHVVDPDLLDRSEPIDPLGTILLGHPTRMSDLTFRVPSPDVLGRDGAFSAFRVLAQDAAGFEAYLDEAAERLLGDPRADGLLAPGTEGWIAPFLGEALHQGQGARLGARFGTRTNRFLALREVVAAQMCGRWRNGVPVALSPDTPLPDPPVSLTDFDYAQGSRCPAGAHMRRCNPRGGPIVQRIANYTRRLVRRGMSYGPDFDPLAPDAAERGLLGNFIGANLGAQFEAVMCDWLNLGLQDPDITGSNDPLLGANAAQTSWFDLAPGDGGTIRLRGLPRFVTTRGGAYLFLPSLPALRHLSQLEG